MSGIAHTADTEAYQGGLKDCNAKSRVGVPALAYPGPMDASTKWNVRKLAAVAGPGKPTVQKRWQWAKSSRTRLQAGTASPLPQDLLKTGNNSCPLLVSPGECTGCVYEKPQLQRLNRTQKLLRIRVNWLRSQKFLIFSRNCGRSTPEKPYTVS